MLYRLDVWRTIFKIITSECIISSLQYYYNERCAGLSMKRITAQLGASTQLLALVRAPTWTEDSLFIE